MLIKHKNFFFYFFSFIIAIAAPQTTFAQFKKIEVVSPSSSESVLASVKGRTQFVQYKQTRLLKLMGRFAYTGLDGYTISDESTTRLKLGGAAVTFAVDSGAGEFSISKQGSEPKTVRYEYALQANEQGVLIRNCAEQKIDVLFKGVLPKASVVGFYCQKVGARIFLGVSTLGTLEVNSSSLPEIDGKGEPWRVFDLGSTSAEETTLLDLSLGKAQEEFNFSIRSKKIESKVQAKVPEPKSKERQVLKLGAAYAMSNISLTNSYSNASPGLYFSFQTKPFALGLAAQVDFKQFFAPKDQDSIASSDLKASVLRRFDLGGPTFQVIPNVFFVNSKVSQVLSNFDLNIVSFGVGAGLTYTVSERNVLEAGFKTFGLGSEVVSSATNAHLSFSFNISKQYNLMVGYELQNIAGKSSGGTTIKSDQSIAIIALTLD